MSNLETAYNAMVDEIILNNNLTRPEAGDVIEAFGPTMSNSEARFWIDAVAVEYDSLGIIANDTYVTLRNSIVTDGAVAAKDLFDALISRIHSLPETTPVNNAIVLEDKTQQLAAIPGNIATITADKTGGTSIADVQLDSAYDVAIAALEQLQSQLV